MQYRRVLRVQLSLMFCGVFQHLSHYSFAAEKCLRSAAFCCYYGAEFGAKMVSFTLNRACSRCTFAAVTVQCKAARIGDHTLLLVQQNVAVFMLSFGQRFACCYATSSAPRAAEFAAESAAGPLLLRAPGLDDQSQDQVSDIDSISELWLTIFVLMFGCLAYLASWFSVRVSG